MGKNPRKSNTAVTAPEAAAGLNERIIGLLTLAVFTVVIALCSMLLVNITVFPVTLFAVSRPEAFTFIIKHGLRFGIIFFVIAALTVRAIGLSKLGFGARDIASYLSLRFLYYLAVFGVFLLLTAVIVAFLYFMFTSNYYLLYKLISG